MWLCSSKRDRFFILCRFALFASAIDFLCAFAWWWLCSSKRNNFLTFAAWWWLCSSKRNSFLNLCRFAWLECNRFPLCFCLVVGLQFQAKQLLNLCRLVCLLVWSFNLHLKRNSVTASLILYRFALFAWCVPLLVPSETAF